MSLITGIDLDGGLREFLVWLLKFFGNIGWEFWTNYLALSFGQPCRFCLGDLRAFVRMLVVRFGVIAVVAQCIASPMIVSGTVAFFGALSG